MHTKPINTGNKIKLKPIDVYLLLDRTKNRFRKRVSFYQSFKRWLIYWDWIICEKNVLCLAKQFRTRRIFFNYLQLDYRKPLSNLKGFNFLWLHQPTVRTHWTPIVDKENNKVQHSVWMNESHTDLHSIFVCSFSCKQLKNYCLLLHITICSDEKRSRTGQE